MVPAGRASGKVGSECRSLEGSAWCGVGPETQGQAAVCACPKLNSANLRLIFECRICVWPLQNLVCVQSVIGGKPLLKSGIDEEKCVFLFLIF